MKEMSTLNVKIDASCEKITPNMKKNRLSKCIKHFDSKCRKIDAIRANFILPLFVKIGFYSPLVCSMIIRLLDNKVL